MKNICFCFFIISILCVNSQSKAQVADLNNKWLLSAQVGYTDVAADRYYTIYPKVKGYSRSFTFSPTIGYFISNSQQVGVQVVFRNTFRENKTRDTEQSDLNQSFGLGVYTRNYSWLFKHFGFYLESGLRYTYDRSNSKTHYLSGLIGDTYTNKGQGGTFQLYLRPGLTWQINQRIGIDFTTRLFDAGYRYNKQKATDDHRFSKSEEDFWANISNSNQLLQNVQLGISVFI
ncbi:hypothetical protein BKI52_35840 [marine bacterium AO1-C]|nr:hypothetical protein BKI52_35840 [marine bacterium AO1-C]